MNKKAIVIILFIALIIRLLYAYYSYFQNVYETFSDDKAYYSLAINVLEQVPVVKNTYKLSNI